MYRTKPASPFTGPPNTGNLRSSKQHTFLFKENCALPIPDPPPPTKLSLGFKFGQQQFHATASGTPGIAGLIIVLCLLGAFVAKARGWW